MGNTGTSARTKETDPLGVATTTTAAGIANVGFTRRKWRKPSSRQIFDCNVKISELGRSGNIKAARQLFNEMPQRDVVTWNAIVAAYWQNGLAEKAKSLFLSMPKRNVVSWNSMVAGCIENGMLEEACEYFQEMPERSSASWNAMISGFVKFGKIEEARKLFEAMPQRNVISYTAMVAGYAETGELDDARALFDRTPNKNAVSWTVMINGYVENGRFEDARKLFHEFPDKDNVVVLTTMLSGYCKEGDMEHAEDIFQRIQQKDIVSWNAMISGYAQNGQEEKALKLQNKMLRSGMKPDSSTLTVVLTACGNLASLWPGKQAHVNVIKYGFRSNNSTCNSLLTMYSRCGSIRDSDCVFEEIQSPGLVSWNAVIAAHAQHGHHKRVLSLFSLMQSDGLKPDAITFKSILSVCAHSGKIQESLDHFYSMVPVHGVVPTADHYSCMVDILSRAGQLDQAYALIGEMPFEPDGAVWGALLGACCVHQNVELGALAARKLAELEPHNSGPYISISNIYATAGMWKDVTRVRLSMREKGVKKQPAYSWTEIDHEVHFFTGGDVSHPKIDQIHEELARIDLEMKLAEH
ncbi:Pentatricopeptide repeat-containing protein [Nymphaea thermarum]|nr:Pentatricopeptide repeat-containing protein [Nymphaea thermarum]